MSFYRNTEGYFDPTAGEALSNISRKERSDRRKAIRKRNRLLRRQEASKNVEICAESGRNEDGPLAEPR
jgi:CRISPR/Cas system Type II protein with McrA/HNH and RuvC-like nuclease domain